MSNTCSGRKGSRSSVAKVFPPLSSSFATSISCLSHICCREFLLCCFMMVASRCAAMGDRKRKPYSCAFRELCVHPHSRRVRVSCYLQLSFLQATGILCTTARKRVFFPDRQSTMDLGVAYHEEWSPAVLRVLGTPQLTTSTYVRKMLLSTHTKHVPPIAVYAYTSTGWIRHGIHSERRLSAPPHFALFIADRSVRARWKPSSQTAS